ncbi:efflux transporter outer membrane subunit [Psychrobacter sp. AOP22-C1-22]|uniref:efflux transporter outer membrane subunit n=1 Tax=unclassified Psychrobacter TaxID=196806 RepID=UPI0017887078|nr:MULTISPECIES: efflux transporter outer membrane subunit [unclassified Psychrobacter]MBE0406291.1 efflux transporter outer membrane subunit [Psychrobacter sp. FME6]MBE0445414.1 efflux transporter outer membrane subunit [Psychrobacter sp. FME5]MDN5801828.1 efflux transporter outer membrane subunit [Psychrobacter sp.]
MSFRSFFTPNSATKAVVTTALVRPTTGTWFAPTTMVASVSISRIRKNSGRLLGLSALAMSMAACNTIPKADTRPVLAEPNVPIEQTYGAFDSETVSNGEQPSIASQRWQNFYSDERLKGLIALGLENNKDFENARLAIEKARAQYQITDIRDLPTIDGSAGYSRKAQNNVDKNPNSSYNVNLGLANYELDFWGKIASLKDQALQNFLSTAAAKDSTQISLISNIAQSYANLSYSLAQLKLAEATVESREKSLFIADKRFEAGIDPKLPSLQSGASLENAKLAVLRAQSSILKSRNALQFLVGAPIPGDLIPTPAVSNITNQQIFNAGLPSELLRYRPDVLQAEYNLKAAGANIKVARASYFPSISLASSVGVSSGSLDDLFKSGSVGWSFGPSISVPIFDAGRLDAEYDVAKIEQEQTLTSYEKSIQTAFREVSDVLATRATLGEQLEAQYRLQDNFEQTYQIADARFKAGISNYLDVLDAQRSLFSTQQGILDLELQKAISQVELYQVLGGGANLNDVPSVIPVPRHNNLTQVAYSDEAKAANVVDAASSARVASPQEALAIKQSQSSTTSTFEPRTVVDVNNDGKADAAVGTVHKETTVEQLPEAQVVEP